MSTTNVKISANGGNVSVKVSCEKFPQSVVGVIWRYNKDTTFDKKVGTFQTDSPTVDLGPVNENDGKLFQIEGLVVNKNDDPPTPYEVDVDISQDGKVLKSEVPADGGSGKISDTDMPFVYQFSLNT